MIRASQGEQRYYQALAKQNLGQRSEANAIFHDLIDSGASSLLQGDNAGSNSFNPNRSIPQSPKANEAIAHFNIGLGYSGLGNKEKARQEFNDALTLIPDFLGVKIAFDLL